MRDIEMSTRYITCVGLASVRLAFGMWHDQQTFHAFAPIKDQIQFFILRFGKIYKLRLFLKRRLQSMESLLNWLPFC
jgi:hypothetical protein